MSKADRDPAEWLPPNRAFWCRYLEDWLVVKRRWGLSMDAAETAALQQGLDVCALYENGDKLEGRH